MAGQSGSAGFFSRARRTIVLDQKAQLRLVFYLAIPLLLGFISGWHQAGRTAQWPKFYALNFWLVMSVAGWWMDDLITRAVAPPLRAANFPLWSVLLIGVSAAAIPADQIFKLWAEIFGWAFPDLPFKHITQAGDPYPASILRQYINTHVYGLLMWPLINLGLFHFLNMPRYGFQPAAEPLTQVSLPPSALPEQRPAPHRVPFFDKLPVELRGNVLALEAEQHYMRVYTSAGSTLILYRLSDAMRELGAQGMQVHRSFWVAYGAVTKVDGGGGGALKLVLKNGIEVPVSRSFRIAVQAKNSLRTIEHTSDANSCLVHS